ncbi:capsular biosynthesis protein [Fulvimonas soli]|uniref:Lysophospholipase L1-like esterase n=2 Tax=Fulvimonas soli TaxID=155197 RepID=A0A316I555_9GAMM|nr:SGNH/GDSL hydrolase family protein [Fulvimonas soli]PWK88547.1 lysophospholipase L1-like esterase [Fulvimonas soli]TNY27449.1 capsular biosynthesis protein [Fulvimonas soli]
MTRRTLAACLALAGVACGAPAGPSARAADAPVPPSSTATPAAAPPMPVEAMRAQLADWANLARYRAENAALPPPAPGERRVVFMGDSITDAWGRQVGAFFPGKPYVNRGISGQTTPQMLVRFMPDVVRLRPAAVVILAGTNDIAGNTGPATPRMIEDNLAAMAAIARQHGIKVVLASILPAAAYPWRPGIRPAAEIRQINGWIRDYCAREGLVYLDYHAALADAGGGMRPGLSSDGVHPTAAGYALMAPLAEAAIARALGR